MQQLAKYDKFIDLLRCPLSGKIFLDPVLYKNIVYERWEILQKCPAATDLKTILQIRSLVENFLKMFPQLQKELYCGQGTSNSYIANVRFIHSQLRNKSYDILLKYTEYNLTVIDMDLFVNIMKRARNRVVRHFVENIIQGSGQWFTIRQDTTPIHFVCSTCSSDIIKLSISKIDSLNTYMAIQLGELIDNNSTLSRNEKIMLKTILSTKAN